MACVRQDSISPGSPVGLAVGPLMALPQRRVKSGRVKENYEAAEMVARFDAIRDFLVSSSKSRGADYGPVRSSDLAKLCGDLQQFMEVRALGGAPLVALGGRAVGTAPARITQLMMGVVRSLWQDNFGLTAKHQGRDWVMTRLPAKLFRNFKANGPLYTVSLRACTVARPFESIRIPTLYAVAGLLPSWRCRSCGRRTTTS